MQLLWTALMASSAIRLRRDRLKPTTFSLHRGSLVEIKISLNLSWSRSLHVSGLHLVSLEHRRNEELESIRVLDSSENTTDEVPTLWRGKNQYCGGFALERHPPWTLSVVWWKLKKYSCCCCFVQDETSQTSLKLLGIWNPFVEIVLRTNLGPKRNSWIPRSRSTKWSSPQPLFAIKPSTWMLFVSNAELPQCS